MVVEDDSDIATLLQWHLVRLGFQVAVAYDGNTGLALAQVLVPDILILNFLMPGMTGIELLRRLRARPRTRNIRAIVTSAAGRAAALALEVRACGFLLKPFSLRDVTAAVEDGLGLQL